MRQRLFSEIPQTIKPQIQHLIPGTTASNFNITLNSKTNQKELAVYDKWTDTEETQLGTLKEWLDTYKKQDIDSKIRSLKNIISKYVDLIRDTRKTSKLLSPRCNT